MDFTKEQLKAAYALNLCTVSISQIIEYNDTQIMEQEYEAILNNLNLEQMPKDEALLNILKQLLDTITFFRIQEGDKQFIEREYQQKMKNAIWSAVPNIGMIVAGGNPVTMAISLASQVGIGYMNYRRAKADAMLEADKQKWQLERTAIEQFNGLRRELFDTAWRLAATYQFPDQLRLTEHQIKQYNSILMDSDLIRKYERLEAIKEHFYAYPPFWYQFGNTANAIAGEKDLELPDSARDEYRMLAMSHFKQYRSSNEHGLLREDQIAASCALELLDLLDPTADRALMQDLLEEAITYSGRANDVLQLASIAYLKLNEQEKAIGLLRQLVNEQYNTVLNAQLLSSLYVSEVINHQSISARNAYAVLQTRVGEKYLYPMPTPSMDSKNLLENHFIKEQQRILFEKYRLVIQRFIEKYAVKYGQIIPPVDYRTHHPDSYYQCSEAAIWNRKLEVQELKGRRADAYYKDILRDANVVDRIFAFCNELYEAVGTLDCVNGTIHSQLGDRLETSLKEKQDFLKQIQDKLESGHFGTSEMLSLLDLSFVALTNTFFQLFSDSVQAFIASREEMQDFSIAEENLSVFCVQEDIPLPEVLYGKDGAANIVIETPHRKRFSLELLSEENPVQTVEYPDNSQTMEALIAAAIPSIVVNSEKVEFYTEESAKLERYFSGNPKLSKDTYLKAIALAVLDDTSAKGGYDLIFTHQAVTPVRNGIVRSPIAYKDIKMPTKTSLKIDGVFYNTSINVERLYELIQKLAELAQPLPEKNLFPVKLPFIKK